MQNTIHSPRNIFHIPVRLDHLRHLYETPEFDPFVTSSEHLSGFERIFKEMRRRSLMGAVRATIYLPAEQSFPDLEPVFAAAVRRLCDVHTDEIDDELATIRWEAARTLLFGLLVWAACLFLALFFDSAQGLAEFPRLFISEGLIIIGWVALWYPVETILYEWWHLNRDKKVYERMKEIEIRVVCMDEAA